MLHIYIDTNVLVRFFAYSNDALTEIEKLLALIKSKAVHSYTTEQTIDEYLRNRDRELSEAIKRLDSITTSVELPRFAHAFDEASKLLESIKAVKAAKSDLMNKVKESLSQGSLKADQIIDEILSSSELISRTGDIIFLAELRAKLGNPPGKSGLGDQINWECLLSKVPDGTDLHIISRDSDYSSKDDRSRISRFLMREWQLKKKAEAKLYNGLSEFTQQHFPNIKVPSDAVKIAALKKLISSGSFANTHQQIAHLEEIFDEITGVDATHLMQAMIDNDQIHSIKNDIDVKTFYKKLFDKHYLDIPSEMESALEETTGYLAVPF